MRAGWTGLALLTAGAWAVAALVAPEQLSVPVPSLAGAGPLTVPPFGCDDRGVPLLEYATQGAAIVLGPAWGAGLSVVGLGAAVGVVRAAGWGRGVSGLASAVGEVLGALPRWVVVLVVALCLPRHSRSLYPMAAAWVVLSAPGVAVEVSRAVDRIGGERFVEALHAHGFSWWRIYGGHVLGRNLRGLLVRQGTEAGLQVVFLEIALSAMSTVRQHPALTHSDSVHSWSSLLYLGYAALLGYPTMHALGVSALVLGGVAGLVVALRRLARER